MCRRRRGVGLRAGVARGVIPNVMHTYNCSRRTVLSQLLTVNSVLHTRSIAVSAVDCAVIPERENK